MSYELIFWRQGEETTSPPAAIYRTLNEGQQVPGLVALPIDNMIRALQANFPTAVREPNGHEEWLDWVSADGKAGFEATWSLQHVRVDCRHVPNQDMNRIIDIAAEFGCALYDPQVDQPFAQP